MINALFPETEKIDLWRFEKQALQSGFSFIAGIDEAGRGPLAGPVVATAVVLPLNHSIQGVNDSKKLTEKERNRLFGIIQEEAIAVGVGISDNNDIDSINILQATLRAMEKAVNQISPLPDYLLIDGISRILLNIPQKTIKKGDSLSISIAAASIIAKVTRDRIMENYDKEYPSYGFARHKGYGSAKHLEAIAKFGPSPIHRKTFRGVKEYVVDHG